MELNRLQEMGVITSVSHSEWGAPIKRHSLVEGCLMTGYDIPNKLQSRLLKELHVGHPGIVRLKKIARSYLYWPNIDNDCETVVRNCSRCQENANNPIKATLERWPTSTHVWQKIHADFAGPMDGK
ncbi:hypothetical protein OSTOST_01443 [Ostertagia ostertagi]